MAQHDPGRPLPDPALDGSRLATLVLLALTLVVFAPHLRGDFVWDDTFLLQTNPDIAQPGHFWHLVTSPIQPGATIYRPLTMATFWLQVRLGGLSVPWLRLGNLATHAGCAVALWAWLRRQGITMVASLVAAAVFTVHPTVTEAVQWLNGRHDTLGALFTLGALHARLHTARPPWVRRAAMALATMGAVLCKETFLVLPAVLAVDAARAAGVHRRRPTAADALDLVSVTVPVVLVVALRHGLGIPTGGALGSTPVHLVLRSILGALRHDLLQVLSFTQGPTVETFRVARVGRAVATASVLGLTVVTLGAWTWRARSIRASLALWGVVQSVLFLLPVTVAMMVTGLYANRYAYLPCMTLAVTLSAGLDAVVARRRLPPGVGRVLVAVVGVFVCAVLGFRTATAAADWRTESVLFAVSMHRVPNDGRAVYHYAVTVQQARGCTAALPWFQRATALAPRYDRAWHNLAGCLLLQGRYADALVPARQAWSLAPWDARNAYNLGLSLAHSSQPHAARPWFARALALDPTYLPARAALGHP